MIKTFTVLVDKASIVAEDFQTFTISLNVTDENEEPLSNLYTFTLEIKEPEPGDEEDA